MNVISKKIGILSVLLGTVLCCTVLTVDSYAYEGDIEGFGGDTHYSLAYDVYAVNSLKPYFNELTRYGGYSLSNFAKHSNWEPDPQHSWGYLFDSTLYNFNLNENSTGWNFSRGGTTTHEFSFGALLHALADSAVPCKHAPVEWEFDDGHDYWESQAVDIVPNYTSQPSPTEYLSGNFSTKETALYALKTAYVAEFKNFWNGTPPYRSLTELQYEAAKTMQIAADAVLKQYFDHMELLTPDYVLIDWTFDEGDSGVYGSDHQYIYNHHGSFNANLVRGWTHGSDGYDGTWDTGFDRSGAWRGKLLSENGGGQTYCKSFGWTSYEARTLTKVGVDDKSFAMEFAVSPDSLPISSTEDNVNPPTLMNFYDTNGGPGKWHLTGFYKSNPELHDCVRFDYQDSSNGYDSLIIDLTSQGFTVTPGKWYYVAIDYNYDVAAATGTLRLVVRDMQTGVYKTASKAALPAKHFYGSSTPLMLIGGDSDDSDLRPFDGRIDRIRYHNKAIANARRLYWNATLADWKFDENTGQLVQNTSGSGSADLQFGSSTGSDTSDPTWTTGFDGSAMLGRKYTAGNVSVYARDNGWTLKDKEAMTPGNSYSVEVICNPTAWPSYLSYDKDYPMGVVKYQDTATGGKTQYFINLLNNSSLQRCVRFNASHADGTSTTYVFNAQAAGVKMTPGKWYYIGAIYTDHGTGSGSLEVIVRDMATGRTVSGTTASKPLSGLTTNPTTTFLVGSEYTTSSGRCFDGKIDEVRISNIALPDGKRLYGGMDIGDWGYFNADIDRDGYVDNGDLGFFFDYWLQASEYSTASFVVNGDAEWGYDGYGWLGGERPDMCSINRTDEASACFQISNAGNPETRCDFSQTLLAKVVPGEPVLLTFRYKTLPGFVIGGPGGAKLQLRFFDINDNWKGEHDVILTSTNGQWVNIEAPLNVLSDASICKAEISVKLRHWDTAEGTLRFDDIQLYNKSFGRQDSVILNSGAESTTDFQYWYHSGPATIVNRTGAANGASCFEMDNTAAPALSSDLVTHRYTVTPGEPLILSFSYKTLPGFSITDSYGFRLQPRFWDSNGNFKGEYNIDMTPTYGQWKKVSFLFNAISDSAVSKLDIRISLKDFGVAVGKAQFDNVEIHKIDTAVLQAPLERIDADGFINFEDFAEFTSEWLKCSDPANSNCQSVMY